MGQGPILAMILLLFAGLVIALLGVAALPRFYVMPAVAGLCAVGAVSVLGFLAFSAESSEIAVPLGLPGGSMRLALDGLSGVFLLLLFVTASACAVHGHGEPGPLFPLFVAAMALALLAADAFTLLLGFEAMSLASWAAILVRHEETASREAALLYVGMAAFSAA